MVDVALERVLREEEGMTNGNDLGRTNNGMDDDVKPMGVDVGCERESIVTGCLGE